MKSRLYQTLKKYAIVLTVLLAYLIFVLITKGGVPCFFYKITGYQCPSCGISRMFLSVLRFDFSSAFEYNQYLFINAPVILICLGISEVSYIKHGVRNHPIWLDIILWVEIGMALLFGVFRNLM